MKKFDAAVAEGNRDNAVSAYKVAVKTVDRAAGKGFCTRTMQLIRSLLWQAAQRDGLRENKLRTCFWHVLFSYKGVWENEKKLMLIIKSLGGKGGLQGESGGGPPGADMGGYRTSLFFTSGQGDATEYAASYAMDYDTVACIGGDGTLSEVISGLMELDSPPPLGYIPMGTANDVATTLALPKNNTVAAARRIVHGTAHPFDVGGFGEREYFAYIAAFGAFTEVSYATPQSQKKVLGHLAYVLQGAWPCRK